MTKVIVVDDDHSTTILIRMLLEMEGYTVSTYASTDGALTDAADGVAAFIIDCYLGKDARGVDMLRAIRTHSDADIRSTPIIMVSGDQRLAQTVLGEGADRFLVKPYSPSALARELHELVGAKA